MSYYKTEITSAEILSDNALHQRLLFPYKIVRNEINGNVLELGCGWGRGLEDVLMNAKKYTGIDRNHTLIRSLREQYPEQLFKTAILPELHYFKADQYDTIVSFQVIEHIKDDRKFVSETRRLLKQGGKLILTTCNKSLSLSRNPWHIREYYADDLKALLQDYYDHVEIFGIDGNERVWEYYHHNRKMVTQFTKWDLLNLQNRLPAWMIKDVYELANRMSRNRILQQNSALTQAISWEDYMLSKQPERSFDFYCICY